MADDATPRWKKASEQDFAATDVNEPLRNCSSADCSEISRLYKVAADAAEKAHESPKELTFAMLGSVASFMFTPNNRDEPFSPMARFGDRRTAQPSDFIGPLVAVLAGQIARLEHPAIRTRVADLVWLLDRKQVAAGQTALRGYLEIVTCVRDGTLSFRTTGIDTHDVAGHLRRGMQIAKALGWETEAALAIRRFSQELRESAFNKSRLASFRRLATLDLDYRISDPAVVASEANQLSKTTTDLHGRHSLLHIAARGYRKASQQPTADALLLEAGECLVSISASGDGSAMFEVHWLEKAIAELQQVPSTRERRRQLKHLLVDAQSRIFDELTRFSHEQDISPLLDAARAAVADKPLMQALGSLANLSIAPMPEALEQEAREQIAENPLSAIIASTTYDSSGKAVHKDAGINGQSDEGGLQRQIAQSEGIRRSLTAREIESARLKILEQHYMSEEAFGLICGNSAFVPGSQELIFVSGILSFFRGDTISALHTLVPQLENSLRHVVRMHGHDVTKLNDDMTQQDLSLSALLDRLGAELCAIFGPHMVADINNVFNYPGGPNLRNRVAHGLISDGQAYGPDSIYGCWLIFQLCCIPLFPHWEELSAIYDRNA